MYHTIGEYCLRDWQMADAPSIVKYANNRKIWLNLRDAFPFPYRLEDARAYISRVLGSKPGTIFAIATPGEAIGSIGLIPGKDVHRFTAELGYWLAEPYWGKGIMTRAVEWVTGYALETLKMHRVFAEPYATNPASARVLEKAGFTREGVLRSSAFKDGKRIDQLLYSSICSTTAHEPHAG